MSRSLKSAGGSFLLRPLNAVFAAPSHAPVLRCLFASGRGQTGREVARGAGVAQRAALDALGRLEDAGIVRRTPAGKAFLFELRRENGLVENGILPLLRVEAGIRSGVFSRLRKALQGHVEAAWVFGSAARGEDRPESDLDVLALAGNRRSAENVQSRVSPVLESLRRDFQLRPSILVMTSSEFLRGLRSGKAFMKNVAKESEVIAGKSPLELVHGTKVSPGARRSK